MEQPSKSRREALAEDIANRLDLPVTVAGLLLVIVLVADNLTSPASTLDTVWVVLGWALWSLFVLEFVARLIVAPSTWRFLRRNWWQLVFLAVPFLRFLRAFSRGSRLARAATTSVRGTRTAGRTLAGRIGWLAGLAVGTVLVTSELLFTYADIAYASALHACALGAVAGEPLDVDGWLADVLEVVLAIHAAVVFATLAGAVGAFFFERQRAAKEAATAPPYSATVGARPHAETM
jgi:voltage-gated potassium channel